MQLIYQTNNLFDAHLVKHALEDAVVEVEGREGATGHAAAHDARGGLANAAYDLEIDAVLV